MSVNKNECSENDKTVVGCRSFRTPPFIVFLTRIKFSFKVHVAVFNEGEEGFQEKQDLLEELKIKEDEKKKEDKKIKEAKKINEAKQMAEKKAEAEKYLIIFSQVSFVF